MIYLHATNGPVRVPIAVVETQESSPVADAAPAEKPETQDSERPSVSEPPAASSSPTPAQSAASNVRRALKKKVRPVIRRRNEPISLAISKMPPLPEPTSAVESLPSAPVVTPVAATVASSATTPALQPHTVTIPAGTSLTVRLNEKLSTEHNYTGDTFRASLDTPIVMNGFIIADRGAKVLGRIVKAQKAGKMEGLAQLCLVLTEVSTTDGQRVALETNESLRKGPSNTSEEVVKMAGAAALGAIIGAIAGGGRGAAVGAGAGGAAGTGAVLMGRGRPAVIADETRLTFELANALTLTEQLN